MAYTFDPLFATDPNNAANVASNAAIIIFDPADVGQAPITITDVTGASLPNPITVNKNGFGPAFVADIDRVGWFGGGFTGYFTSYEGLKAVAVAAQTAAETAASTAGTAAADAVEDTLGEAALAASTAAANAESAATSASNSAAAAANSAALVGAPADSAIATAIGAVGSATKTALDTTYGPGDKYTLTVKKDGTGDFTSPKAANDSITDAGPKKLYTILVHPGTYEDAPNWRPKPYVTIRGTHAKRSILKYAAPDNIDNTTLQANSTLWIEDPCTIDNITIVCDGGQYVVHSEKAGVNQDALHITDTVTMIHLGYDRINVWRAANSVALYSGSANVWGAGSASGVVEKFTLSTFQTSGTGGFYFHNNAGFTNPTEVELDRCKIITGSTIANGVTIHSLGSGTDDKLTITNSQLNFMTIQEVDNDWRTDAYADHSDFTITLNGCNPVGYYNTTRGQALRIISNYNGAEGSSIKLTGTAVPVIFGEVVERPYLYANLNSVNGNAYGTLDISGITLGAGLGVGKTLGVRLGDRTASPLSLTITNKGNYSETISFNTDFTAMTNAQVVAWIDAALGGFATPDIINPSYLERYPFMGGHESTLINTGTVALHRFQAVVYTDSTRRAIRRMETADAAALFAGITLEAFVPGKTGRILHRGYMRGQQMRGYWSSLSNGSAVYASDTGAGDFLHTGTRQVATGVNSEYAYFHAPAWK